MSSMIYTFAGRPGSLDECLDYVRRHGAERVHLSNHVKELPYLPFSITQFIIDIAIEAGGRIRRTEYICAGFLQNASEAKREQACREANAEREVVAARMAEASEGLADETSPFTVPEREVAR